MTWTKGQLFLDDQGSLRNGWKVGAYLVGTFLAMMAYGLMLAPLRAALGRHAPWLPEQWVGAAAALTAAWVCLRLEEAPLASLGLKMDLRFLRDLFAGSLGGMALMLIAAALLFSLGGFHPIRTPGVGPGILLQGAWLYLAVAAVEEILFRGYPFQRSVRGLGFTLAQVVFALLFSLSHWGNPGMAGATKIWASVNIGLASVLLAFCWRRTGSLALPIGVHLGWNWAQGSLLGFGVSGTSLARGFWTPVFHDRPEWFTGGAFGLEASVICTVVCGAGILGLWWWKGTTRVCFQSRTAPRRRPARMHR